MKRCGGVCIYFKEDIACIRRLDLEPTDVELMVIEVFIPSTPWGQQKSSWIIACSCRPSPAGLDKVFLKQLERLASSTVRYKKFFVRDFNAKNTSWWSDDTTSINGQELKCLVDDFYVRIANICRSFRKTRQFAGSGLFVSFQHGCIRRHITASK